MDINDEYICENLVAALQTEQEEIAAAHHRRLTEDRDRLRRLLEQEQHRVAKLTAECDALIKRVRELEEQR